MFYVNREGDHILLIDIDPATDAAKVTRLGMVEASQLHEKLGSVLNAAQTEEAPKPGFQQRAAAERVEPDAAVRSEYEPRYRRSIPGASKTEFFPKDRQESARSMAKKCGLTSVEVSRATIEVTRARGGDRPVSRTCVENFMRGLPVTQPFGMTIEETVQHLVVRRGLRL